jgi:hypothetical protein
MNSDESASPIDLLFSKFQAVDSLWKDIREHDPTGAPSPSLPASLLTTPKARAPSSISSRRHSSSYRDSRFSSPRSSKDYETKDSLLSPLLSATPDTAATTESSVVDGENCSTASPMEPPSDPHDAFRRHDDISLNGTGNDEGARPRTSASDGRIDDDDDDDDDDAASPRSGRRRSENRDDGDDAENDAPVPPWYTNPMQVSAMISNFSTSYVSAFLR